LSSSSNAGDHLEVIASSEDASNPGPYHRLVIDDHATDHDETN
jgi:hypothetical protein